MKFSAELHARHFPKCLKKMLAITGLGPWERRFQWIQSQLHANRHLEDWLRERFLLEWALNDALASKTFTLDAPFIVESRGDYELVAFTAGISRIYDRLTDRGKNRLRGMLLDGLKSDMGLLSLQQEVVTATHLMLCGFDVDFNDLEKGGIDFVARKEGIEVEVECKMVSGDLGRKIPRRRGATLYKLIEAELSAVYDKLDGGLIIRIQIPDRLTSGHKQHLDIRAALQESLASNFLAVTTENCSISALPFDIAGSPFQIDSHQHLSKKSVSDFVSEITESPHSFMPIIFSPRKKALVVKIESAKADKVIEVLNHEMRDAMKRQFSKSRPGILAVQLHDFSDEQLKSLASVKPSSNQNPTALHVMTSDILRTESRAHIHAVVYRAHGKPVSNAGILQATGPSFVIKNDGHPQHRDERYNVFGSSAIHQAKLPAYTFRLISGIR